jgi:7-cyano-7-deazaguanine reductase
VSDVQIPLGRSVDYPREYDASLLFPIPRAQGRAALGGMPPFTGHDRWHAYELSWLDRRGKPHVATATLCVPASSPNLIESKSLKLYLNSFNATAFDGYEHVRARIAADLSNAAGAEVSVNFGLPPVDRRSPAILLDAIETDITCYGPPDARLLALSREGGEVEETLTSALLKSNCPVTGQPDWARVTLAYRGPALDHASVLRYLVSFRDHCEFHEQCVERIYADLHRLLSPSMLSVEARYTRRGGLDINPWRATPGTPSPVAVRDERQ